ncbi:MULTISPECIES: hypothetical protein [unclassified Microcoleus]|uniref:hypothetical protein n=1 Tax=unclassified Microcoleus TaxID=2642155 RepID=UPI002FD5A3C1
MPVPQEINFIVEQASCLFLRMVQHLCLTEMLHHSQQGFHGRALLPKPYSPQENSLFVEQASCLFLIMMPLSEVNSHSGIVLNKTGSTGFLDQNLGTCC